MTAITHTSVFQEDISANVYAFTRSIEAFVQTIGSTAKLWMRRHNSRRQLAQLNQQMLTDIGLSQADVFAELSKPFWRA